MKKILIAAAALVLVLVVAAGVLWGPSLYSRLFSPVTPLGRVIKVRTIEQFPESGGFNSSRAVAGYKLWMIEFDAAGKELPRVEGEQSQGAIGRVKLIDDRGEQHPMVIYQEGSTGEPLRVTERSMVFSIPQDRQPRALSFDGGEPVRLP